MCHTVSRQLLGCCSRLSDTSVPWEGFSPGTFPSSAGSVGVVHPLLWFLRCMYSMLCQVSKGGCCRGVQ